MSRGRDAHPGSPPAARNPPGRSAAAEPRSPLVAAGILGKRQAMLSKPMLSPKSTSLWDPSRRADDPSTRHGQAAGGSMVPTAGVRACLCPLAPAPRVCPGQGGEQNPRGASPSPPLLPLPPLPAAFVPLPSRHLRGGRIKSNTKQSREAFRLQFSLLHY